MRTKLAVPFVGGSFGGNPRMEEKVEAPTSFRVARAIFMIMNVIYCCLGIAVIAIGLYFKVGKEEYFKLFNQYEFEVASAMLIAAGVMALVIAIVGFLGIVWKIEIVLIFYMLVVVVIFAVEIAAGALAFANKSKVEKEVQVRLHESMKLPRLAQYWDKLQTEGCYAKLDEFLARPDTAIMVGAAGITIGLLQGCYTKLDEFLAQPDTAIMVGAAGITIGLLQITLLVIAVILVAQLRKYRKAQAQFLYVNQLQ